MQLRFGTGRRARTALALLASLLLAVAGLVAGTAASASAAPNSVVMLAYPAWAPNTWYAIGARVTYNGVDYECIQAHTSLTGWEPPNVPALWKKVSGG
ncbi:carbohydrate-binding protein, partial [Microbispora rosea]